MRQLPLILLALPVQAPAGAELTLRARATIEPAFALAEHRLAELDARPGREVLALGVAGEVRTFGLTAQGARGPLGALKLADPRHCAFDLAALDGPVPDASRPAATPLDGGAGAGARADLFVATPAGLAVHRAGADGAFAAEPIVRVPRARWRLRTGAPVQAPLAQDVDGDGRPDAVVPEGEALAVWLQRPATGAEATAAFVKSSVVRVRIASARGTALETLSDELASSFTIPSLRRTDLDGDGRRDLIVEDGERRAFHMVREGGAIPAEPDSVLDLSIFRDTTPEGGVAPGRTLAGLDRALHEMRDLNGDGRIDHVIAHRRKVWVFRGGPGAPRFDAPTSILKTADDVTTLLLLELDRDARPDLVLVKVQVPSVATLLRGLVGEWSVEIAALGYRAGGEKDFEPTPAWRSELSFRVPAILSILKDPDAIVRRFEDAGKKLRARAEGDLDGDGREDVALVSEDGARLEVWLGDEAGARAARETPEEVVRRVLFEDPSKEWDLDRLVAFLAGWAEQRVQALTGGRPPAGSVALRAAETWRLVGLDAGDLDGDGRAELVLRYDAADGTRSVLDVVGV